MGRAGGMLPPIGGWEQFWLPQSGMCVGLWPGHSPHRKTISHKVMQMPHKLGYQPGHHKGAQDRSSAHSLLKTAG